MEVSGIKQAGGAGKAVASAFLPGLGQLIDGRKQEGRKFYGKQVGYNVAQVLTGAALLGVTAADTLVKQGSTSEITQKGVKKLVEFAAKNKKLCFLLQ